MNGDGSGQDLVFQLPYARTLYRVGLINGYAKTDPTTGVDRYTQERRITHVTWTFGDGTSLSQALDPTNRTMQTVNPDTWLTTSRITLHIDSVTSPQVGFDYTAISDVQIIA